MTSTDGALAEKARERGIQVEIEPINRGFSWFDREEVTTDPRKALALGSHVARASFRLRRAVRRLEPDILHPNENLSRLVVSAAAPLLECRCVTHVDNVLTDSWTDRVVRKIWEGSFDHLIPVSAEAARPFRSKWNPSDEALTVIPEAIDPDEFVDAEGGSVRREFSLDADCILITAVGRLVELKRHEWLIRAVGNLDGTERARVRVLIVGAGPRLGELTRFAERLGVSDMIHFTGHRDDIPAILSETDISVLCSKTEACPRVIVESLAAGAFVIATDVGNASRMLGHGRFGQLVHPDEPISFIEAFDKATVQLLEGRDPRPSSVQAQRRHVREHFSWDRCVAQTEAVFKGVVS
jgi:glycosyltransferase involved in cell wall biosynthesis